MQTWRLVEEWIGWMVDQLREKEGNKGHVVSIVEEAGAMDTRYLMRHGVITKRP
jgi:hypothetical protein